MIPAAAVQAYLTRPLEDHRWVKELTRAQLDAAFAALDPVPQVYEGLKLHQRACLLLGIAHPQLCYWLEMGCVDADTEYLTPTGWRRIAEYKSGVVGQFDPRTREVSFVEPLSFVNRPCKEMIRFKSARGLDQLLSFEHNMLVVAGSLKGGNKSHPVLWKHTQIAPYADSRGRNYSYFKVSAEELYNKNGQRHCSVDPTFLYSGGGLSLTDAQLRVQVAVHADGYLANKIKAVIRIKKDRKKQRLRALLARAGITYREYDRGEGYTSFSFIPPNHTKKYGAEWWACTLDQKKVIVDEVGHWDGTFGRSGSVGFFTRSRECAEFIQFCFASTGRRAYLNVNAKPSRDGRGKRDYCVHAVGSGRTSNLVNLMGGGVEAPRDGRKYCFEVPTGFLVLRRNGNIFTTGNTGKTLLSLELLRYWFQCGVVKRAIVFVTTDKAFDTWERQFRRFNVNIPTVALEGPSERKWAQLEEFGEGVVLVSYPGAVAMCSKRTKGRGKKLKLSLDPKLVSKFGRFAEALVLDESTKCGSHQSLTYQLVNRLKKRAAFRYALAGRPFGRDPTMLWPQYNLVDDGETLGETLGIYRAVFFREKESYWGGPYAKEYKFKKELKPTLSRVMRHRSITYSASECIDLPKVVHTEELLRIPDETKAYYQRLVQELIAAKGSWRETKNIFLRMRQLSSGFIGLVDDETGDKAQVVFDQNPKLERLLELLEELPEGRKACVFYSFTRTGRAVVEQLTALKQKPVWLWSGTKDGRREIQRFQKDPSVTVAVVNSQLAAMSIDGLQEVANYMFFVESPVSVIDRAQAEARLVREGQKRTVFCYDLLVKGTADQRIREYHAAGEDLFKDLMRRPEELLK